MTTSNKITYFDFYRMVKQNGNARVELYRGFTPLFLKQSMAITLLLQSDLFVKTIIRKHLNLIKGEAIPISYLIPASIAVALINTTLAIPLEVLKTQMEKVDSTLTYQNTFNSVSKNGYSAFFTGYRLRLALYMSNALFTVILLEIMETRLRFGPRLEQV